MQTKLSNIRQRWDKAKQSKSTTFWIAVVAIIITLYFGFSRGGWTLGSSAQTMADRAAEDAVVERLAPICVAQFNQDPLNAEKLAELQVLTTSTRRTTYVKDQGWATMPGETDPDNQVAAECARQLMLMDE
ncbi:MAG: hypothetical protein CL608_22985 [Anaerolineaceae bacterium]|nr:hypothetical protein [Anaerolineaceae bacterium]